MLNWRNPRVYLENFLYIRNKRQQLQKLTLKPAQENLYQVIREEHLAGRPVRLIVLKGRQEGISTVTEALGCSKNAVYDWMDGEGLVRPSRQKGEENGPA